MKTNFLHNFIVFSMLIVMGFACDSNESGKDEETFDRAAMLEHYASNIIKPAYTTLAEKTLALQSATAVFRSSSNDVNLAALQKAWKDAALAWQKANGFNFGPAGEEGLRKGLVEEVGTFPVSTAKIENSVSNGQWNLADFNRDARGLLAIEYLLFGENKTSIEILNSFTGVSKRAEFLDALAKDVHQRVTEINEAWKTYATEFTKNAGTDVGSSTSMLYNEFVRSFEALKNFKVGVPLGKRVGQTKSEPQLAEAYYSGESLSLLRAHFNAVENLWYGHASVPGASFRAYLETVVGGKELIASTETQLAAVRQAFEAVPAIPSMAEQIKNSPAKLEALHTELQKLTRFFKSDMSSLLGIAITFSSGDGD
ncbi:imelysin family protein [Haliscomenobacter hydrossis]|uniref:Peptidase M75, Imelysin n=1 Tax=Haliscomenobacter hydrossis (strain ATCC 27775 / DSM 1100 / LMG 10767 / O) TaxID=760192 RepID=F4L2U2_HALH1|nr:imelysin family protein [Haliscomenobacter hydrossis]AEE49622.1 Peptidase M75, Imelysin [Haliscomenobacter hydrossis DSM 1100]